jgi:hypothetical protein
MSTIRRPGRVGIAACVVSLLFAASAGADTKPPKLHRPKSGVQFTVGPVTVERGKEVTECTYFKLPSKRDMDVNKVEIKVSGGSHHVHLYRPQDASLDKPDGHETCNFALDFSVWQLILASQSLSLAWRLPPGIAFHFRGGEQLAAQTHFVDSGLLTTPTGEGWAVFNLFRMPKHRVKSYAGAVFGQDRDVVVPPGSSTATTRCIFPKPVKLLALTGHYHYRGVDFTAGTWDGFSGTEIYHQVGYDHPAFLRFTPNEIPTVTGIQWTCAYENHDDATYTFGPFTDNNEHCNLFAFYYPTEGNHETITCVQLHGIVTTTVHQ